MNPPGQAALARKQIGRSVTEGEHVCFPRNAPCESTHPKPMPCKIGHPINCDLQTPVGEVRRGRCIHALTR